MKKLYFYFSCLSFFALTITVNAQNAIDFDGSNDVVVIPNASAEIANSTNFSISCWFYPTKSGGPYGIVGLRNNTNADFYILQLSSTANSVECRFRNSLGVNYDIVYTGLVMNQWQHYTFTYDTDTIRLYHDGLEVGKQAASGVITNNAVEMRIGNAPWNGNFFWYGGRVDETSLWSKTISPAEASCLYSSGVNPFANDLKLYYDFNQGVANGNNAGITTLEDRTNNINGTATGLSLNGTTSNWVNGVAFPTIVNQAICLGDTFVFGSNRYFETGTYFKVGTATTGCDSITSLKLTVTAEEVASQAHICPG